MQRAIWLAAVLVLGLVGSARAQTPEVPVTEGTPVTVVGEITSRPRDFGFTVEKKMQVAVGPERTDHTLHLRGATLEGIHGERLEIADLQDKWWVWAEGTVGKDPRRIRVSRLRVIGRNYNEFRQSAYYRPTLAMGYIATVAGARQEVREALPLAPGTRVVVVGEITSPPRDFPAEQKMQVAVGPGRTDYTLHFRDAVLVGLNGERIDRDAFDSKMWVRAEGTVMDDPRRIRVERIRIIARDAAGYRASPYYRAGMDLGYIVEFGQAPPERAGAAPPTQPAPAAAPATFAPGTPVVLVGVITSPPKGALEEHKMQVGVGPDRTDYTVHFSDATLVGPTGERIDEDAFDDGMWVRAEGTVMDDPRRIRATRVQVIGTTAESYRQSAFYRADAPAGYIERVAGARVETRPVTLRGTVVSVHPDQGYFVLRDEGGQEYRVYTANARIELQGQAVTLAEIRAGDRATVEGRQVMPEASPQGAP